MKRTTVMGVLLALLAIAYGVFVMFGPLIVGDQRPPSDPTPQSRF